VLLLCSGCLDSVKLVRDHHESVTVVQIHCRFVTCGSQDVSHCGKCSIRWLSQTTITLTTSPVGRFAASVAKIVPRNNRDVHVTLRPSHVEVITLDDSVDQDVATCCANRRGSLDCI